MAALKMCNSISSANPLSKQEQIFRKKIISLHCQNPRNKKTRDNENITNSKEPLERKEFSEKL